MSVPGLYTTVKNTSGAARVFGFLGKHGKRLAHNETYTVPGDLVAELGAKRSLREFTALEKALETGDVVIVNSPAVYLTDIDDGSIDQVQVDDGAVETRSPQGWD
jgi:hypothetical protein